MVVCVPCTSVIRVAVRLEVPVSAVQICLLVNANVHVCVCVFGQVSAFQKPKSIGFYYRLGYCYCFPLPLFHCALCAAAAVVSLHCAYRRTE